MRPVEDLIEQYAKEENYDVLYVTEEDHVVNAVSACNLSDDVKFFLWNTEYVNALSNLYNYNPSLVDKFIQFTILHEDGHAMVDKNKLDLVGYEANAELYAVSRWQGDPLEGITIGLAERLFYGKSRGYYELRDLKKEKIKEKIIDKYCLWMREDLKMKTIDRALELIE